MGQDLDALDVFAMGSHVWVDPGSDGTGGAQGMGRTR